VRATPPLPGNPVKPLVALPEEEEAAAEAEMLEEFKDASPVSAASPVIDDIISGGKSPAKAG